MPYLSLSQSIKFFVLLSELTAAMVKMIKLSMEKTTTTKKPKQFALNSFEWASRSMLSLFPTNHLLLAHTHSKCKSEWKIQDAGPLKSCSLNFVIIRSRCTFKSSITQMTTGGVLAFETSDNIIDQRVYHHWK